MKKQTWRHAVLAATLAFNGKAVPFSRVIRAAGRRVATRVFRYLDDRREALEDVPARV